MKDEKEFTEKVNLLLKEKKFSQLREILSEEKAADIAELLEFLPREWRTVLYRLLPKEMAAEVFVEMPPEIQEALINAFSDLELRQVLDELYANDAADIIEEMPASVVRRILKNATPAMRHDVNELLKYPEDSAGSLMTTEYVRLKQSWTVKEAFSQIRKVAIDKKTVYTCFVTDQDRRLRGLITVKTLMISPDEAFIADIMEENMIFVHTLDDQENVAQIFAKYEYLSLPVVDNEDRLVGIITVDDAMDVIQEETEEDFAKMAGITPTEKPYLRTGALEIFRARVPWLLLLMISATFTGMIISSFEIALQSVAVLTIFIPMLMGTGGNSGSQSSVMVIRGLSLKEIALGDIGSVLWKELRVSLLCGLTLGVVGFGKFLLVDRWLLQNQDVTLTVAFVVAVTLCVTVVCSKLIGCALPILVQRIGLDPAVMASPFITTIVDAISLLVYFQIASSILNF